MRDQINIKDYILECFTPAKLAEPLYEVIFDDVVDDETLTGEHEQQRCTQVTFPFARSNLVELPLKEAHYLYKATVEDAKHVLELVLNTKHVSFEDCQAGDTIGILPRNRQTEVQALIHAMQLSATADHCCRVQLSKNLTKKNAKLPVHIPAATTARRLLRDCLNLHAVPKKQFLRSLAEYCTDAEESAFLKCLSSKEGASHYDDLILKRGLSLPTILTALCPTCVPTLGLLVDHLPRLLPRPYSIANNPTDNEIRIICSVLQRDPGLTSGMLAQWAESGNNEGRTVLAYLRASTDFRYTREIAYNSPQILIGIGTAIAPFLGFLEQKAHFTSQTEQSGVLAETWLFAGATCPDSLPHRPKLLEYKSKGILNQYFESFSRVSETDFHYVQDQMRKHAKDFVALLMKPTTILYVCADGTTISKALQSVICDCIAEQLNVDATEALTIIKDLRNKSKYREDLWI